MLKNNIDKKLFLSLSLFGVTTLAIAVGVTIASYTAMNKVNQQVGYLGETKKTIYFNAVDWDQDNAVFYMYCFEDGGSANEWILPSKRITPTIGGTDFVLYVFEFNNITYDTFILVRMNPHPDDVDLPSWDAKWNQSNDKTYESNYNYYCFQAWVDNGNTKMKKNHITVSNNTMSFDGYDVEE